MKNLILIMVGASLLMACNEKRDPAHYEEPMRNQLEMSFLGVDSEDKMFGFGQELSSVECRHDTSNNSLRVVAYRFDNGNNLKIAETIQLTDYAVKSNKSGLLKPLEGDLVPSFIFLSDQSNLKYTKDSHCSTYYEIEGEELKGSVLCSSLTKDETEETFVSLQFQCLIKDYLLFEVKPEML